MTDITTVAAKEMREILGGGSRRSLLRELVFVLMFGVFFPLSQSDAWSAGAAAAAFYLVIPLFIAGPHVADSFAGEKERKTLETLLATRLPDRAVYLGKILAACVYAWGLAWLILLASVAALSLAGGGLFLYPAPVWFAVGIGSFATSLLIAGVGTFVSLHAETVRAAHQMMMIPLIMLVFGLSLGLPAIFRALPPGTQARLMAWAEGITATEAVAWLLGILFLVDSLLVWFGMRHFRRGRLIGA